MKATPSTLDATEKLLPHLQATLALDWTFPHLRPGLDAASTQAFQETQAQEHFLTELDARRSRRSSCCPNSLGTGGATSTSCGSWRAASRDGVTSQKGFGQRYPGA